MAKQQYLGTLVGLLLCSCGGRLDSSPVAGSHGTTESATPCVPGAPVAYGRDVKPGPVWNSSGSGVAFGNDTRMPPPQPQDSELGSEPIPMGDPLATPYCAGSPTTRIEIAGNLDASATILDEVSRPWDSFDPSNTANFSTSTLAYDALGRAWMLDVYFRKYVGFWGYNVLSFGIEAGNGSVTFDDDGRLLSHDATTPIQLPVPLGSSPVIELSFVKPGGEAGLGLEGLTSSPDASTISWQSRDGEAARWGFRCDGPPPPTSPAEGLPPTLVVCGAERTTRIQVSANLSRRSTPPIAPWDPSHPATSATFRALLTANDEAGTPLAFDVYFRKEDARRWSYHVFLLREDLGPELSNGELVFNASGSLKHRTEHMPLTLPRAVGHGQRLELDLGHATDDAGSGVDGLTSFVGASRLLGVTSDGRERACVVSDSTSLLLPTAADVYASSVVPSPACAGSETRSVRVMANLDGRAVSDERVPLTTQTIYDSALRPWLLRLQVRHAAPRLWEAFATARDPDGESREGGRVVWQSSGFGYDTDGAPTLAVRLPLDDGSSGPAAEIDFSNVTTFDSPQYVWLDADGAPEQPCVEER